ncbi:MAG TPA: NADH-quinone oxidoreductase subunit C [Gemmatimonadaceae bacterium]|nr:NADH-quinone oxidoreductase subunit C [Gemmatimonadaceae bacterium]HRQ77838.1 NADH-quinone oxidoreductase subunit C [Gemmatimonadaceae bacterium]
MSKHSAPAFTVVHPGNPGEQPTTQTNIAHRGGAMNPSVDALRARFGAAIGRAEVVWGDTTVYVDRSKVADVAAWLAGDPDQSYEMLVDVTAVEYRDAMRAIEVVWHIRSIKFRRFLRLKAELPKDGKTPLSVPSVWGVWKAADWMERECYDMFGIAFEGHPDLRRILMWEQYKEGFPLRKDFPMRGRFSRSEQLKQALAANPEARYSKEELSIADAFEDLPLDMRRRLGGGEQTGE